MCVFSMVGGCKHCENREQCNAELKKLLEPEIKKMFEIIANTIKDEIIANTIKDEIIANTIKERNSENDQTGTDLQK